MTEARIADRSKIEEDVYLAFPIQYGETLVEKVTVRTPNMAELRSFNRKVADIRSKGGDLDAIWLPVFDAPDAVLDAMHPDDGERLQEVGVRFLPRSFREDATETASPPDSAI